MIGAVGCFPIMQSCVQALVTTHEMSFVQATWGRYFFHALLVPVFFPRVVTELRQLDGVTLQLLRGFVLFVGTGFAFAALKSLPIPQVTALSFIAPALVTILAALWLKESVDWRRWAAVLVGLIGVLVIVRPNYDFQWAMCLPLGMAAMYALYQALTRLTRNTASPVTSLFFTALVGALGACIAVPFFWNEPTTEGWLLLFGSALFGALGHWMLIKAYQQAEASFIAPFAYTELLSASLVSYLAFGYVIDSWTLLGAVIIVLSGLQLAWRPRGRSSQS